LAAGMSIGAYTTSEPDASVQLSCRISMLFWLAFRPYTHMCIAATWHLIRHVISLLVVNGVTNTTYIKHVHPRMPFVDTYVLVHGTS
jgi:hypothetical protein